MSEITNRQKKLLRFFGVDFDNNMSLDQASNIIDEIFLIQENEDLWNKYVFLTEDFDVESSSLKEFDLNQLMKTVVPDEWDRRTEVKKYQAKIVEDIVNQDSPFDEPPPIVTFMNKSFCFTGVFEIGTRKKCQEIVEQAGANISKEISRDLDYLVVGTKGSKNWSYGHYGNKIEKAILFRRQTGKPSIVEETHCFSFIK
jgi:NAD-dependent DNA ligase